MTAPDPAATAEDEFRERMQIDGDLGMHLCEYLWQQFGTFLLGGEEFEMADDDVPGYEDDDMAVLLRRKSDGQVFEAEIDVNVRRVSEVAS